MLTNTVRHGLTIQFDTWTDDHPASVYVEWWRDDTRIEANDFVCDSANFFIDQQIESFNKIVIIISDMTRPNRFLKIYNIIDGVIRSFYNDEIENLEIIEQIDPTNDTLPINECSTILLPVVSTGVQFQRTLPISVYKGNKFFGKFYIKDSSHNEDKTLYNVSIDDLIHILSSQSYIGRKYTNESASSIIAEILGSNIPYEIDPAFDSINVSGYLLPSTKRDALKQILFITHGFADCSRQEKIIIKELPTTTSATVGKDKILSIQTTQEQIVTSYRLVTNKLTGGTGEEEIFDDELDGQELIIFDKPVRTLRISGGTIVEQSLNYCIISGTGGQVTLYGKYWKTTSRVTTLANPNVVGTDLQNDVDFETTLQVSGDVLSELGFVKNTIKAKFLMEDVQVGDLIILNGQTARVTKLDYDLTQTNIYCNADLEVYYE